MEKLTQKSITDKIIQILKELGYVQEDFKINDNASEETSFYFDLGLDSLDHIEVIMEIEKTFNFQIPDDKVEELNTIEKIANYISNHFISKNNEQSK